MHLINFAVNVQPDPVKFVQINNDYWTVQGFLNTSLPKWQQIGYQVPDSCSLTNNATICQDKLDLSAGVTHCQVCEEGGRGPWTYAEWIFTGSPGVFGLVSGWAAPTGVGLILVLTFMVICSMPFVRMKGLFQLFYVSHLVCFTLFIVLLILHCPDFWKWICVPLGIYIA